MQEIIQLTGFVALEWRMVVMWAIVALLLYLAVYRQFEPLLLVPIAFGALLANLPTENMVDRPPGGVLAPVAGSVVATAYEEGGSIILPRVPKEKPSTLHRVGDAEKIRQLFAAEQQAVERGTGTLLAVIRPGDKPAGPVEDMVEVTFRGRKIHVSPADHLVWATASGSVAEAVPKRAGEIVRVGEQLLRVHSEKVGGLYHWIGLGVVLELFPPLIFLGVGALTDFGPLIANPRTLLLGAAAQFGVFVTFLGAVGSGVFTAKEAAAIGIIGGADGPTSIFLSNALAPDLLAPIAVAAYSYMALVPLIQPPIMRGLTTPAERRIRMKSLRKVSRLEKLIFALVVTILCILVAPAASPLIAMLMLGNFLRECSVTDRLTKAAQNELINIVTIFLGTSVGITMTGDRFLQPQTLAILVLGVLAFGISTACGVLMAKFMNLLSKNKINPLIGSAGVSAVPMAARVSQVEGHKADPQNHLLMHAMGPNVAGVIGTALAAGYFLAVLRGGY